jgi:hypothetical protein
LTLKDEWRAKNEKLKAYQKDRKDMKAQIEQAKKSHEAYAKQNATLKKKLSAKGNDDDVVFMGMGDNTRFQMVQNALASVTGTVVDIQRRVNDLHTRFGVCETTGQTVTETLQRVKDIDRDTHWMYNRWEQLLQQNDLRTLRAQVTGALETVNAALRRINFADLVMDENGSQYYGGSQEVGELRDQYEDQRQDQRQDQHVEQPPQVLHIPLVNNRLPHPIPNLINNSNAIPNPAQRGATPVVPVVPVVPVSDADNGLQARIDRAFPDGDQNRDRDRYRTPSTNGSDENGKSVYCIRKVRVK